MAKEVNESQGETHGLLPFLKSHILLYTAKCLIGLSIGYRLLVLFPGHRFYWTMVTVALVVAPDAKDATKLAFDRMKASMIGSLTGLALFMVNLPGLLLLSTGLVITIAVCYALQLTTVCRTALAAMLIVMINEKNSHKWEIAIERIYCVIVGCVIALLITMIFVYFGKRLAGITKK